jgi:DNA-binding LacI/PurR family transcriptional regulator
MFLSHVPLEQGMSVRQWWDRAAAGSGNLTAVVSAGASPLDELYSNLAQDGLAVPGDITVMAVATEQRLQRTLLPTTGVVLPVREMVGRAVNAALDQLEGVRADRAELIEPTLLELGTTSPPRR